MSEAGLKDGAAGTALNTVLRNLSAPTKAASDALDELNIALYDTATGASRDMIDIMGDLEAKLNEMSDAQRNAALSTIFDTVALKGWNMIASDGVGAISELSESLSASSEAFNDVGQAAGMAAMQSDTLQGRL